MMCICKNKFDVSNNTTNSVNSDVIALKCGLTFNEIYFVSKI